MAPPLILYRFRAGGPWAAGWKPGAGMSKAFLGWLDSIAQGNTVLSVRTITFKVDENEARTLRVAARRAKLTVSEYLRRQIRLNATAAKPVRRIRCRYTGAMIFGPAPQLPPLNTETVTAMLVEFP